MHRPVLCMGLYVLAIFEQADGYVLETDGEDSIFVLEIRGDDRVRV